MSASRHQWTASDGVDLVWDELGEGRAVVLLHGLFSNAEVNWIKFGHAAAIAARGFRVIMPHLRAHGDSAKPQQVSAFPSGILARDVAELIAHLRVTDYDLGGFSLGARTTVQGIGEGLRPRRAILGGMGYEALQEWARRRQFFVDAIAKADSASRGDPHWLAIQFMKTMKIDRIAAGHLLNAFEDVDLAWLDAFTMPTLVVCGAEDHDNGSAPKLAAALPDATYVEVPGTHMSSVTKAEFGCAIADFLDAA